MIFWLILLLSVADSGLLKMGDINMLENKVQISEMHVRTREQTQIIYTSVCEFRTINENHDKIAFVIPVNCNMDQVACNIEQCPRLDRHYL